MKNPEKKKKVRKAVWLFGIVAYALIFSFFSGMKTAATLERQYREMLLERIAEKDAVIKQYLGLYGPLPEPNLRTKNVSLEEIPAFNRENTLKVWKI